MQPTKNKPRILQIYSGNRNRNLFPSPSSFEIPFAPTFPSYNGQHSNAEDVVCKGGIYYKFVYTPQTNLTNSYGKITPNPTIVYTSAVYAPGSTRSSLILDFGIVAKNVNQIIKFPSTARQNYFKNFYKGFELYNVGLGGTADIIGEKRIIRTYDPQTNTITLDRPLDEDPIINTYAQGFGCYILNPMPSKYSWFIPTLDSNLNTIPDAPLYYNGYYLVFGSGYPPFVSENGPPFFRRIIYYDYLEQLAYFSEPLPFDFSVNPPTSNIIITLRKNPPLERLDISAPTYYNTKVVDPLIGPLPGYIITLPSSASSIDNYYKGKYIYNSSAGAQTYSPPLPPQEELEYPITISFYPIYGLFYISAYNGTTKECSIQMISSKDNNNAGYLPTFEQITSINSSSLVNNGGFFSITNPLPNQYRGSIPSPPVDYDPTRLRYKASLKVNVPRLRRFRISITLRVNSAGFAQPSPPGCYFEVENVAFPYWSSDIGLLTNQVYLTTAFRTYSIIVTSLDSDFIIFNFYYVFTGLFGLFPYIEWKDFTVYLADNTNILEYQKDNFSPLDYNGTMVDTNETVCYNISLKSLTLPNKPLITGSKIAFYPYVYVVLENYTSPSKNGNAIIISNNNNSNKAVFIASCAQVSDPERQAYVTIPGSTSQTIKFKPNDNLRFSVYLSDGSPFQPLTPDLYSPYEADISNQINAIFTILRIAN